MVDNYSFQNPSSLGGNNEKTNISEESIKQMVESSIANGQKIDTANEKLSEVTNAITSLLNEVKEMKNTLSQTANISEVQKDAEISETEPVLMSEASEETPAVEDALVQDIPSLEPVREEVVSMPEVLEETPVSQNISVPEVSSIEPVKEEIVSIPEVSEETPVSQNISVPEVPSIEPIKEETISMPEVLEEKPVEQNIIPEVPSVEPVKKEEDNIISIDSLLNSQSTKETSSLTPEKEETPIITSEIPKDKPQKNIEILDLNLTEASGDGRQRSILVDELGQSKLIDLGFDNNAMKLSLSS